MPTQSQGKPTVISKNRYLDWSIQLNLIGGSQQGRNRKVGTLGQRQAERHE